MWFIIIAAAIVLVLVAAGIAYVMRAKERVGRKVRKLTPTHLDRSPEEPHRPGATS